jgi:release factor glutamine methyltransferase
MRIVRLPGVFAPRSDTWLLAEHLRRQPQVRGTVLDVCTGSGALAITAALAGARFVTATDVSRRALATVRINARLNGIRVRACRGTLLEGVPDMTFDMIVSNPPYLPSPRSLPTRGTLRHTEAGSDGRLLLDRLIAAAPAHLRPGGVLMVTHSSINDEQQTLSRMRDAGLEPSVLARRTGPLGPLLAARAPALEAAGLLTPGEREEDLLIVAGIASQQSRRRQQPIRLPHPGREPDGTADSPFG